MAIRQSMASLTAQPHCELHDGRAWPPRRCVYEGLASLQRR